MRVYIVETRNFEFHICAKNTEDFKVLFLHSWKKHCDQYDIPLDLEFYDELVDDYQNNYIDIRKGYAYRDRQHFNTYKG